MFSDLASLVSNDLISLHASILPLSLASVLFNSVVHLSLTMILSLLPFTCVYPAITIPTLALALSLAILKLARVHITIGVLNDTLAVLFVVEEIALVVNKAFFEYISAFSSEGPVAEPPD